MYIDSSTQSLCGYRFSIKYVMSSFHRLDRSVDSSTPSPCGYRFSLKYVISSFYRLDKSVDSSTQSLWISFLSKICNVFIL